MKRKATVFVNKKKVCTSEFQSLKYNYNLWIQNLALHTPPPPYPNIVIATVTQIYCECTLVYYT